MSKNRPKPPPQPPPREAPLKPPPRRRASTVAGPKLIVRIAITFVLMWHVFAVFMAPLSIPPSSQLVVTLAQGTPNQASPLQWYLDALYLNHGYHFFAPDPGASHLIRYRVTDDRNQMVAEGEFPDLGAYWPRLRYHRHFMLSEQVSDPMPGLRPRQAEQLKLNYYAHHLLRAHNGEMARVTRVQHKLLSPKDKIDGHALDDPRLYETTAETTQRASDLAERLIPPASAQPTYGAWHSAPGPYRGVR